MIDYFAAVTFLTPTGDIPVGAKIPKDLFSEEQLASLLRKGAVTTLEAEQAKVDEVLGTKKKGRKKEPNNVPDWAFDPASLEGNTIEILNLKIAGRAQELKQEVEPFDTVEEAILFMTAEWQG